MVSGQTNVQDRCHMRSFILAIYKYSICNPTGKRMAVEINIGRVDRNISDTIGKQ